MTCCAQKQDFCVSAGETFLPVIRWALSNLDSYAITAISQSAPAVITMNSHAIPDGWPVAVVSVRGMDQINGRHYPPAATDMHYASYISGTQISLNSVNSADYSAYVSGGFVVHNTPVDMTGASAQMRIYDAPEGGTLLMTLTDVSGITINNTDRTIRPRIDTAAITWTTGYYDLEMTDAGGVVTQLLAGVITIES
jgi:hypothetical protein